MNRVTRSVKIARPPDEVFRLLTDLDRLPEWATIVVDTRDVSATPLVAGATFRQTVRVLGQNVESEWRVHELDPPRLVAYEAAAPGGGTLDMAQRVIPQGEGARIELEVTYELPGGILGALVDAVYAERHAAEEAEHSLANLKDLLEGRTPRYRGGS